MTPTSAPAVFRQRLVALASGADPARMILGGLGPSEGQEPARGSRYTHIADHHEIVSPIQGTASIALPDRVVHLSTDDVLLIERGVTHSEIVVEPLEAYEVFWCHVRGSSALLSETRFVPPSTWRPLGPLDLSGRVDLENVAAALARELALKEWGWQESVRGLLHYLVATVVRRLDRAGNSPLSLAQAPAVQADPRTWNIVRGVLEFCEANYRNGIGLQEVAAALGYSPSYLSRLVSRHLGRSLSDHIQSRRMDAAKQLLEDAQWSIGEIAEHVGYADPAHFSRAFNRVVGVSPKAYRARRGGL